MIVDLEMLESVEILTVAQRREICVRMKDRSEEREESRQDWDHGRDQVIGARYNCCGMELDDLAARLDRDDAARARKSLARLDRPTYTYAP